jgi:hypothetical protein
LVAAPAAEPLKPVVPLVQPIIPPVSELRMRTSQDLVVEEEFGCEACQ